MSQITNLKICCLDRVNLKQTPKRLVVFFLSLLLATLTSVCLRRSWQFLTDPLSWVRRVPSWSNRAWVSENFSHRLQKTLRTTDTRKINYTHSPAAHSWEEEEHSKNSLRHQTLPLNSNLIQSKTSDPWTTRGSWKRPLSSTPSYRNNNRNKIKNDWSEVSMS